MEIRDVIHGSIKIEANERGVLDSKYFQRLRHIKQLGFAEYSYPTASHNRYVHSLGAMNTATQVFESVFGINQTEEQISLAKNKPGDFARLRAIVRLAALLHDIGHGPLSHTTEFAMPDVKDLKLPAYIPSSNISRKATHEDYTLKIILDSGLTPILEKALSPFNAKPIHVASLIDPAIELNDGFFNIDELSFRPILQQIISSELDADRMDYLRRDSYYAGVSYGNFDFQWIVSNLSAHILKDEVFLSLEHRALYAFEDFLISRYHMFLMVYFHYKSVVFDEMLAQYLNHPECPYKLPSDIEAYCESNDAELYSHLSQSQNEWAKRINLKRPYRMLIELHSGIPATKTAVIEQKKLLTSIEQDLSDSNTHYLTVTSTGELSKYFRKPGHSIFVRYDNHYSAPSFIPLQKCTDLFTRYHEKRSITRLYVPPERFAELSACGRKSPLRYEDVES